MGLSRSLPIRRRSQRRLHEKHASRGPKLIAGLKLPGVTALERP